MQEILPWQQKAWQYLLARKKLDKLPHAILINGADGVGKGFFAKNFASFLLCQNSQDNTIACGKCGSCELYKTDNHPDLIIVGPDDKGKSIKIDQIRGLIAELSNTAHFNGHRVVIVESADLLNVAAANALLKTLEEPFGNTVIILVSAHLAMLSATIRSRCQTVLLDTPKYFVAKEWLEKQLPEEDVELLLSLSENSPFKALDLASGEGLSKRQKFLGDILELEQGKINSVQMVKGNLKFGLENSISIFIYLVSDLIKIKLGATGNIVNRDQVTSLNNLVAKTTLEKLFFFKDSLYELRRHFARKINVNQQMAMENLVISWLELSVIPARF